jgi:hypothetical protein
MCHRTAIEADGEFAGIGVDTNPLDCDLLVVDETSMVDVLLMQALLMPALRRSVCWTVSMIGARYSRRAAATRCWETCQFQLSRSSMTRIACKTCSIILQPRNLDFGPQVLLPAQEFEHMAVSHIQC